MVLSAVCHDSCNMIAALADGKFTVWYYPNAIFVDKDLLAQTVYEKGLYVCVKEVQYSLNSFTIAKSFPDYMVSTE